MMAISAAFKLVVRGLKDFHTIPSPEAADAEL